MSSIWRSSDTYKTFPRYKGSSSGQTAYYIYILLKKVSQKNVYILFSIRGVGEFPPVDSPIPPDIIFSVSGSILVPS